MKSEENINAKTAVPGTILNWGLFCRMATQLIPCSHDVAKTCGAFDKDVVAVAIRFLKEPRNTRRKAMR
jgi:hypothetical protein